MGHELAVEVLDGPEDCKHVAGQHCVVNPYLACGKCVACRSGKPNCCVSISVLGVHTDGGMTGLLHLPPENLIAAPGLTLDECAAVEFLAIGAHAVRRAAVKPSDRVLVVGAGPIGLGVALFARNGGATVSVFDRDFERAVVSASIAGASVFPSGVDPVREVMERTGGEGFDVVFDATGSAKSMCAGFDFVTHGGRYVLVGVVKDALQFSDSDFHRKEMTLFASRNALAQDFEQVMAAMRSGEVAMDHLITHRTNMADAVADIPRWANEKNGLIKAMMEID